MLSRRYLEISATRTAFLIGSRSVRRFCQGTARCSTASIRKIRSARAHSGRGSTGYTGAMEPGPDFVALLRRWEDAGGLWRVLRRAGDSVTVGLYRCDGGEETDRFVAADAQLARFLAGRTSSQDQSGSGAA